MIPMAFLCWLASLTATPLLDDTFCVDAARRPFCGPPQMVRNAGYVYIQGDPASHPGKIRLIRRGTVMLINTKKIRSNPNLDVKLEPGDTIQIPQTFF